MPLGTAFSNKMWDHFFGGADQTRSSTVKIALYTTAPNYTDGTGGTEVTDATYARVDITNNTTNFPAATAKKKSNGVRINFTSFTASATVVAWGMFDAGNAWMMGAALTTAKTINAGDPIYFDPGDLSLEFT
jgi:hypothetical protein